jgi:hypothetical protein
MREIHTSLLENSTVAKHSRVTAAAFRPIPAIDAKRCCTIRCFKRGADAVL